MNEKTIFGSGEQSTRRSFVKQGTLTAAGIGLLSGASASGAAQDQDTDDGLLDDQEWDKAILQTAQFRPASRFVITSPVVNWQPNVAEIRDNLWSNYNTRVIRYLNTSEQVPFWMAHDAEVPDFDADAGFVVDAEGDTAPNGTPQPEVFRMRAEYAPLGASGFVTVNFTPVGEDEEDNWLDNEDWWFADDEDAVGIGDDIIPGVDETPTQPPADSGTETGTEETPGTTNETQ